MKLAGCTAFPFHLQLSRDKSCKVPIHTLRDKLEVDRYQSLVLYFLMSIFRCKTFFKDNEMAIKIDNYNKHKQYQKEEKLASQMFYYWEVIDPIPFLKPLDLRAFASASSLLVHH